MRQRQTEAKYYCPMDADDEILFLAFLAISEAQAEARYNLSSLFLRCHMCALGGGLCIKYTNIHIGSSITSRFWIYEEDVSVNASVESMGVPSDMTFSTR